MVNNQIDIDPYPTRHNAHSGPGSVAAAGSRRPSRHRPLRPLRHRLSQRRRRAGRTVGSEFSAPVTAIAAASALSTVGPDLLPGRQLAHDIGHEMGTISLLASVLERTDDIGVGGRQLAAQLTAEVQRASELTSQLCQQLGHGPTRHNGQRTDIRLDHLLRSIVEPVRLTSDVDINVVALRVVVRQNRLALWRAVRNVVCNALDAVGATGCIQVRLFLRDGYAIIDVDDDGPGLSSERPRAGALGLSIVEELAADWGGWYELGRSALGGCRVRLMIPLPDRDEARV
jgi:signal transduction histidine kinase